MKKDMDLVKSESEKLYYDIIKNGYEESLAKSISEELKEKGGYLFNLSHSVEYAVLTLQTAFLKANHTNETICEFLNSAKQDKIGKIIRDAVENDVKILPPNINKSKLDFEVIDGKILFGLSAIKGVGIEVCKNIIKNAPYSDLKDFMNKMSLSKDQIISLIKSGAFGEKKKDLMKEYFYSTLPISEFKPRTTVPSPKDALKYGIEEKDTKLRLEKYNIKAQEEFELKQKEKELAIKKEFFEKYYSKPELWEFESLNMFLTDSPFDKLNVSKFSEYEEGKPCVIPCIITKTKNKSTKKGNKYMEASIFDGENIVDVKFWSNHISKNLELLKVGKLITLLGIKEESSINIKEIKEFFKWKTEIIA